MPYNDRRAQIERGRKAGLQTRELYATLASRAVSPQELSQEIVDENGYSVAVNSEGRIYFRPGNPHR